VLWHSGILPDIPGIRGKDVREKQKGKIDTDGIREIYLTQLKIGPFVNIKKRLL